MSAVREQSPRVRLMHAAETAPGKRVLVDRDDLLAVLAAPLELPPVDLDALTGTATPAAGLAAPEARTAPEAVQAPDGRARGRVVALAAWMPDARDLARHAWDSDPERVAEHGRWEQAAPWLTWGTAQAALRALAALVEERSGR